MQTFNQMRQLRDCDGGSCTNLKYRFRLENQKLWVLNAVLQVGNHDTDNALFKKDSSPCGPSILKVTRSTMGCYPDARKGSGFVIHPQSYQMSSSTPSSNWNTLHFYKSAYCCNIFGHDSGMALWIAVSVYWLIHQRRIYLNNYWMNCHKSCTDIQGLIDPTNFTWLFL